MYSVLTQIISRRKQTTLQNIIIPNIMQTITVKRLRSTEVDVYSND